MVHFDSGSSKLVPAIVANNAIFLSIFLMRSQEDLNFDSIIQTGDKLSLRCTIRSHSSMQTFENFFVYCIKFCMLSCLRMQ